jgi:hypothetical protein
MPLSVHVRLPLTEEEHAELLRKAGELDVTVFLRKLLGFERRRPGRPPKAKPRSAAKP